MHSPPHHYCEWSRSYARVTSIRPTRHHATIANELTANTYATLRVTSVMSAVRTWCHRCTRSCCQANMAFPRPGGHSLGHVLCRRIRKRRTHKLRSISFLHFHVHVIDVHVIRLAFSHALRKKNVRARTLGYFHWAIMQEMLT